MLKRFSSTSKLFRDGNIIFCIVLSHTILVQTVQRKSIVVIVCLNIFHIYQKITEQKQ